MICRCIRWHAAKEVPNKDIPTLLAAISDIWIGIHGPPKEFLMDGETAVAISHQAKEFFDNHSTKLTIRATGKHCHFIEKRGDLLKTLLRKRMRNAKPKAFSSHFLRC